MKNSKPETSLVNTRRRQLMKWLAITGGAMTLGGMVPTSAFAADGDGVRRIGGPRRERREGGYQAKAGGAGQAGVKSHSSVLSICGPNAPVRTRRNCGGSGADHRPREHNGARFRTRAKSCYGTGRGL